MALSRVDLVGSYSFLASASKPRIRAGAVVGLTLADEVQNQLPRFHFQSRGHPLEKDISLAEQLEFQTLWNEYVWERPFELGDLPPGTKIIDTLFV